MSSILASFITGQQAGQQNRTYQQEQSKLAQLQQLAPQVLAGDPAAYAQSMALDSAQTTKLQDGRAKQLSQLEGLVKHVDEARASGDPRRLTAAMRDITPFVKTFSGVDIDPNVQWTPDFDAGWDSFKAMVAGARNTGTQPSQFTALDLQAKAAGYQPGTQGYQDFFKRANGELARQSGAAIQYKEVEIDGRKVLVAVDPREIGAQVIGGGPAFGSYAGQQPTGAPAQQATRFTAPNGEVIDVSQIQDPHVRQQIMQNPEAWGMVPDGSLAALPASTQQSASIASNPFASRRAEDQAAATERAKLQAQADYLPQELAMRGQAAVEQAVGVDRGKAGVEREQLASNRQRDAGTALELLGEAERLLPQATGGRVAAVGDAVAGAFGVATGGAQANAALATIAGQLTSKMPRMEGPQSDRDVQMYKEMAGDLANANLPVEVRMAALRQIRRLQAKYANGGQASAQRGPQAGAIEDGYRFKGGNPADPNNWERI